MASLLGHTNQIDTATLSGGAWAADYPISNLQNKRLARKARSTSTSATVVITLPAATDIGIVAVCSHNLTNAATVRVQGGTFDSGTETVYPAQPFSRQDYACLVQPEESAAEWTITISDATNPAGYVEFGRIFIGPTFAPATCVDWGYSDGLISASSMQEALAGPEYFWDLSVRRSWQGQFSWLTDAEAAEFRRIMRLSDIGNEVYWCGRSEDTAQAGEFWFLGRFSELSPIAYPYLSTHSVPISIRELI